MILFLHGPETYLTRQKLHQITDKAREQGTSDTATTIIDGQTASVGEVSDTVLASSLLADRRLVIMTDWLATRSSNETADMLSAIKRTPPETILVIVEYGELDKRLTGFKQLVKLADKTWYLTRLDEPAARRFLLNHAKKMDVRLSDSVATKLLSYVGTDLWSLTTELQKLAVATTTGEVTEDLVTELVQPEISPDIFGFVDAIGERDVQAATTLLATIRQSGEPDLRVFAMIVRQFRILLGVQALLAQPQSDAAIAKQLALHPFVVHKARAQAKHYSEYELRSMYGRLAELDELMKTGRRDPGAALELFVIESCQRDAKSASVQAR